MPIEVDFGNTNSTRLFYTTYPNISPLILGIIDLTNKCVKSPNPLSKENQVIYGLCYKCRQDFLEISHLAVSQYGDGALKILRVLYERSITAAYLMKHPDETDKFIKYFDIIAHKQLIAFKSSGLTEADWNNCAPEYPADVIESNYVITKSLFEETTCKECKKTRIRMSWNEKNLVDLASELDGEFKKNLFNGYSFPNLAIHTNISSANIDDSSTHKELKKSYIAILTTVSIMLELIKMQNEFFKLGIEKDVISKVENLPID